MDDSSNHHHGSSISKTPFAPVTVDDNIDIILESARHLCEETRVVLTSLRGGPPNVARGDLAQELTDLRHRVKTILSTGMPALTADININISRNDSFGSVNHSNIVAPPMSPLETAGLDPPTSSVGSDSGTGDTSAATTKVNTGEIASSEKPDTSATAELPQQLPTEGHEDRSEGSSTVFVESPHVHQPPTSSFSPHRPQTQQQHHQQLAPVPLIPEHQDVGPYARPFLAVVMDPRAAGPHTLVALRALHRLLERNSLNAIGGSSSARPGFGVVMEPLTKGVLNCKFEQTDAGADEAVEMAIADLLVLMVTIDRRSILIETLMDAFNTVFITRNTFVHSPALCYHFEDVLTTIVRTVFEDLDDLNDPAGRLILEFLVNQLLHTPLVGGDDEASREAQMAHNATRVLCLRLTRCALKYGMKDIGSEVLAEAAASASPDEERGLLQIVQDDLFLSLLLTGQAIWTYQDNVNISPGFISLEVLSEICSTLSTLWTSVNLRKHLVPQFEAIFSGFYQRALVLLRKRLNPTDSISFHANFVFDAGIEIILESLVEIMCLHDNRQTVVEDGGCLETLFATYDCNIRRSDVAVGLMIDLCRCLGSKVDEEGDIMEASLHGGESLLNLPGNTKQDNNTGVSQKPQSPASSEATAGDNVNNGEQWRNVPPHLKELCADCIIGSMKCLFQDDHPSEYTKEERRNRDSIMKTIVSTAPESFSDLNRISSSHHLRNIKSKKRLMRKAAYLFNIKSRKGIEFLVSSGILAEPVTPRSIASFLRNGIVVGLDKKAVGMYLGEIGKPAVAGKSPKVWERDWFHKEVLESFCSLFHFDRQSLLDGLRMFLACFRLPGEAQQIDRILQNFADSCGNLCEESSSGSTKLFSNDPKRASDVAFLLSFSIIMLNTDQHNDNIREDRRMKKSDFVKYNTDYGKDITEPGKELPREYLETIYDSIREEEIKTEGEGADGSMTVERWKDVLRGSAEEDLHPDECLSSSDAEDLSELVLEQVWMPIMSSISALWGVKDPVGKHRNLSVVSSDLGSTGMHGAQGARLGMDIAWEMLIGVRQLGRKDIFCNIFKYVCKCSGLLDYSSNAVGRSWAFANSVEAQSAIIVALNIVHDASSEIDEEGWKYIWALIFELRDLKMLGGGVSRKGRGLLKESDSDLLRDGSRRDWTMKLLKKDRDGKTARRSSEGIFASVGRALFGSVEGPVLEDTKDQSTIEVVRTIHGKEDLLVWDEIAPSDDEDESFAHAKGEESDIDFAVRTGDQLSLGRKFENQLIKEDMIINRQRETPVTGLERVEDTRRTQISPRARVRKRLSKSCDFSGLVSDSRFMDDTSLCNLLGALLDLISQQSSNSENFSNDGKNNEDDDESEHKQTVKYPISPASETFAEVLICEIALKNRDRLAMLWHNHLGKHYYNKLDILLKTVVESQQELMSRMSGPIEKSITGLLRISCFSMKRGEIVNDVLFTWSLLDSYLDGQKKNCILDLLDRHIGEGLWRITRCVDDSCMLSEKGRLGILSLVRWSVHRGSSLPSVSSTQIGRPIGLADDDPSIQAYRSLHYLLNVSEAKNQTPPAVGCYLDLLVITGDRRNCPKLSIAGLDLLQVLSKLIEDAAIANEKDSNITEENRGSFWKKNWLPVIKSVAKASRLSVDSNVRQHALAVLTDSFLDKQAGILPVESVCEVLGTICIPLAGQRIIELRKSVKHADQLDGTMIEVELCVSLIFKPFRHHMKIIIDEDPSVLMGIWIPTLNVIKEILNENATEDNPSEKDPMLPINQIIKSTNELTIEHLQNIVMVLISFDVLKSTEEESAGDSISIETWKLIGEIPVLDDEWKKAVAKNSPADHQSIVTITNAPDTTNSD